VRSANRDGCRLEGVTSSLHSELQARDLDFTAVGGLTVIPGPGKFRLHGKRLLYADRPDDE
jgi:hypothetical protein